MLQVTQINDKKAGKAGLWELLISVYIFREKEPEKIIEREI